MPTDDSGAETSFPSAQPIGEIRGVFLPELAEEWIEDSRQNRRERKRFSSLFFALAAAWLAAVLVTVGLEGWDSVPLELSDPVLLALLGSTTTTVFSLLVVVAKYLFPS